LNLDSVRVLLPGTLTSFSPLSWFFWARLFFYCSQHKQHRPRIPSKFNVGVFSYEFHDLLHHRVRSFFQHPAALVPPFFGAGHSSPSSMVFTYLSGGDQFPLPVEHPRCCFWLLWCPLLLLFLEGPFVGKRCRFGISWLSLYSFFVAVHPFPRPPPPRGHVVFQSCLQGRLLSLLGAFC